MFVDISLEKAECFPPNKIRNQQPKAKNLLRGINVVRYCCDPQTRTGIFCVDFGSARRKGSLIFLADHSYLLVFFYRGQGKGSPRDKAGIKSKYRIWFTAKYW